jgi:hypothetical protein
LCTYLELFSRVQSMQMHDLAKCDFTIHCTEMDAIYSRK